MRWTILVKFPVAFSGGRKSEVEPEPGGKAVDAPREDAAGEASIRSVTRWPGPSSHLVSLEVRETQTVLDDRHQDGTGGDPFPTWTVLSQPCRVRLATVQ